MNSQQVKYLTEAYSNVYSESDVDCQELYDSFLDLCILDGGFTTLEECEDFAESLVADNLVEDFIVTLLEYYEVENLNESFEFLGENRAAALRSVINALSSGGRLKYGLKAGTAIGKKAETVVKGGAASTSIRGARAQRTPTPTPFKVTRTSKPPQEPGKYLRLLQQKTTPKPLSSQGQEIKDYNKMMGGGGVFSSKPGTSGRGAPGIGNPIQKAIDFGRGSKEVQRLALRAQRMAKGNYGKLLNTPLGKAAAATLATAGLAAAATSTDKKTPAAKSNPADSVGKYNTKDSDGTVRDRLKVGPKIVGTGSVAGDFDVAFKKAKTSGAKEFDFKDKKYNTKTRSESVDNFDMVLDILLSDGYVNTYDDAVVMMSALDESAIARIAALSEQKFRIINKDGTETISDTPLHRGSGAASTVKPIGTGAKYSYKDENPYKPRAGESD